MNGAFVLIILTLLAPSLALSATVRTLRKPWCWSNLVLRGWGNPNRVTEVDWVVVPTESSGPIHPGVARKFQVMEQALFSVTGEKVGYSSDEMLLALNFSRAFDALVERDVSLPLRRYDRAPIALKEIQHVPHCLVRASEVPPYWRERQPVHGNGWESLTREITGAIDHAIQHHAPLNRAPQTETQLRHVQRLRVMAFNQLIELFVRFRFKPRTEIEDRNRSLLEKLIEHRLDFTEPPEGEFWSGLVALMQDEIRADRLLETRVTMAPDEDVWGLISGWMEDAKGVTTHWILHTHDGARYLTAEELRLQMKTMIFVSKNL